MSKTIAKRMNQPAHMKLGTSVRALGRSTSILLANVMATKPHTPFPSVSSVGRTAIFFTDDFLLFGRVSQRLNLAVMWFNILNGALHRYQKRAPLPIQIG